MRTRWFDERFETKMAECEAAHVASLAIIATQGTLDWAYPPFILASTASAPGWDVRYSSPFTAGTAEKKSGPRNQSPGQSRHAHENALRSAMAQGYQLENSESGGRGGAGI